MSLLLGGFSSARGVARKCALLMQPCTTSNCNQLMGVLVGRRSCRNEDRSSPSVTDVKRKESFEFLLRTHSMYSQAWEAGLEDCGKRSVVVFAKVKSDI
jgi:hypothetical protein